MKSKIKIEVDFWDVYEKAGGIKSFLFDLTKEEYGGYVLANIKDGDIILCIGGDKAYRDFNVTKELIKKNKFEKGDPRKEDPENYEKWNEQIRLAIEKLQRMLK